LKSIVSQFIFHIEKNEQAATNAHSQAKNVYERVTFVLTEVSDSDFQVVF